VGIDEEDDRLHPQTNGNGNRMKLFMLYLIAILVGVFVAFIISKLAKRTKSHPTNINRPMEFDPDTEKDLIAIKSIIMLSPDFSVGGYTLNSPIRESSEIEELSEKEYLVIEKKFEKEVIYKAPPIKFLEQKWAMLIGTVAGKIYKLHLNSTFFTVEEAFRCNALTCHSFETRLGEATDKSFENHSINHVWDTRYGNVHLGYMSSRDTYNINISATSNKVRTFNRL
jgi:hypothetical protein